jgi:hypothetical protein
MKRLTFAHYLDFEYYIKRHHPDLYLRWQLDAPTYVSLIEWICIDSPCILESWLASCEGLEDNDRFIE